MNAAQDKMDVIRMQHARITLGHTHVNAKMDLVETELCARILMNAAQDKMDVIRMQHARILLVHTHVNAIVDSVEMELCARM